MNLFRTQRKTPGQEHGDWRLPLEKPAETEHLPPREPTVWRKMRLRARYLQAMPVGADSTYASEEAEGTSSLAPIAGWSRFVRLMLAWLILLPLSILLTYALLLHLYRAGDTVGQREFWLSVPVWYSLLGAGAFISLIVARIATPILVYIYVLGHELTHAIAAIICLGRVQTLRIGLDGGYVETDTDNLFIALSPYFVPLWMGCWMVALWCSNLACPFPEWEAWFSPVLDGVGDSARAAGYAGKRPAVFSAAGGDSQRGHPAGRAVLLRVALSGGVRQGFSGRRAAAAGGFS